MRTANSYAAKAPGTPLASAGPAVQNPDGSFDWNWRYDPPSCSALTVLYPSNIPDNQTNDVNVRIRFADGTTRTLNYHFNGGNWTGMRAFNYVQHPSWPAGTSEYWVEWTQVGGSNYHYGESFHNAPIEGPLHCVLGDDGDPETVEVPQSVTTIDDWDTAAVTPVTARVAGATSLLLWAGVVLAGRWIGHTI